MTMDRRTLLGAGMLAGAALSLPRMADAAPMHVEEIDLWRGEPPLPGGRGSERIARTGKSQGAIYNVMRPRIRVYRPARPNGTGMLVMGGGGYFRIELGNESTPVCEWLAALGVTGFELIYRMPDNGWPREAPFADAQRAMRLIRARAGEFGIDPKKLGVLGFSAGAHLAGMTAVQSDAQRYAPIDAIDQHSARPAAAGLIYPVLDLSLGHTRTTREIVGDNALPQEIAMWSVNTHVSGSTPPVFTTQAADDPIAPIGNSLRMFDALEKAGVPHEMHVFQQGGHGFALGDPGSLVSAWPRLFVSWARSHGLFGAEVSALPAASGGDHGTAAGHAEGD